MPTALSQIVDEYITLSCLNNPTEQDLDKLSAILSLASVDPQLTELIKQADHQIADKLGLQGFIDEVKTSDKPIPLTESNFVDPIEPW